MLRDQISIDPESVVYEDNWLIAYWQRGYFPGGHLVIEWQPTINQSQRIAYGYDHLEQVIKALVQVMNEVLASQQIKIITEESNGQQIWHLVPRYRRKNVIIFWHNNDLLREQLQISQVRKYFAVMHTDFEF